MLTASSLVKRHVILLAVLLTYLLSTQQAGAVATVVYDPKSGHVLSQKDAGAPWYPASLTKLMTAYVAFKAVKAGKTKLSDKMTMSPRASAEPPSKLGLPPGAKISLGLALKALLIRSTNDLAVAIAEHISGSVEKFAQEMNATAKSIGMTGSYFVNPHGLPDPRQVTTARDMAILGGRLIKEFSHYNEYYDSRAVRVGKRSYSNRNNKFLNGWDAADGMKTGYICNSGFNLVASATVDGRRLVGVVLGSRNSTQRANTAQKILKEAFDPSGTGSSTRSVGSSDMDDMDDGINRRTVSTGTPISRISNGKVSTSKLPKDMAPVVCKHRASWRTIRPYRLKRRWTATFGKFESPKQGYELLRKRLLDTRNVVHGGNHGLIRLHPKKGYMAALGNLTRDQAGKLCKHLKSQSHNCSLVAPDQMVKLAEEDDAFHKELQAKRKAAAKKRRAEAKRKAKKRRKRKRRKRRRDNR
ncbi:MAG: D-alanyl-D-alanine carboxypeptidase family protein [Pseudomonadota bacterium]